ncbi:hypothetical protein D030_4205, partial [Vibrio parahaemolyticus AQ3810]
KMVCIYPKMNRKLSDLFVINVNVCVSVLARKK